MLRWSLFESAGHFWQSAEYENVTNLDLENIKHLQNHGHLLLTAPIIIYYSQIEIISIGTLNATFPDFPHARLTLCSIGDNPGCQKTGQFNNAVWPHFTMANKLQLDWFFDAPFLLYINLRYS